MEKNNNTTGSSASQQQPILITRYFDLPVDTLWKAWSDPETFKKWWGPKDFTCPVAKMDFRVGGEFHACMRDSTGKDYWSKGTYKEIVPNKRIVMTDSFSDEEGNITKASDHGLKGEWPKELLVTLEFGESDGRSSLWLKHEGIPAQEFDNCIQGWEQCFDKLEKNIK